MTQADDAREPALPGPPADTVTSIGDTARRLSTTVTATKLALDAAGRAPGRVRDTQPAPTAEQVLQHWAAANQLVDAAFGRLSFELANAVALLRDLSSRLRDTPADR